LGRLMFLCIIIGLLIANLIALDFQIEKIDEFSISSNRQNVVRHNVRIEDNYLYTLTNYGLEIYLIENDGSLNLLSRKPIIDARTLELVNDNVYVGTTKRYYNPFNAMIYKINITDHYNPQIVQTLEFDENVRYVDGIFHINGHLLINMSSFCDYTYPLLNYDLELVMEETPIEPLLRAQIDETRVLVETAAFEYLIYDLNDLDNITTVGSANISEGHSIYQGFRYKVYQDSVLIVGGQREMSFWDISDPNNWTLFHNIPYIQDPELVNYGFDFHIVYNFMIYLNGLKLVVIDLNDYSYHQILEMEEYPCTGLDGSVWNSNVYITTVKQGIQRFVLTTEFHWSERIGNYFSNSVTYKNGDDLYVGGYYWNKTGTVVFDVSNPYEIVEINRIGEGDYNRLLEANNDLLIVHPFISLGEPAQAIEVMDVSCPLNPSLRNVVNLDDWYASSDVMVTFDKSETGVIYVIIYDQYKLLKFDISEPGEAELLFELNLPYSVFTLNIDEGILYHIAQRGNTYIYDLRVYSGLEDNEPILTNTVYNIGSYSLFPNSLLFDDYLAMFVWAGHFSSVAGELLDTNYYSLTDPLNPVPAFKTGMPGRPHIKDDLLFQSASSTVSVFDLSQNVSGTISPSTSFLNNAWPYKIFSQHIDDTDFLYCVSHSSISVYEYSYTVNTDDDIVAIPAVTSLFQNYPNPFNPETKIEFYLEKGGEVKLEIFNIRGQRLAVLIDEELPQGEHSLIWNPKTATGKDLPSGVYLYRLQTGDYDRTRKMLYLK